MAMGNSKGIVTIVFNLNPQRIIFVNKFQNILISKNIHKDERSTTIESIIYTEMYK